ncbi:hypothetical protein [Microbacterium sp. 77mftsu3.1]|uniref:hypothetical protein n=1 Tax=Microbacterium sp. 77mftsu3.1 TaxID=1761802 RepID=UPI00088E36EE|nr:hypothetical protein [Microbacterium sp. 77mftsu3.1]SDG22472.1 hypothetical protein SAMN04488590_0239 [Microbacterium sp. 77mftsu3.1]
MTSPDRRRRGRAIRKKRRQMRTLSQKFSAIGAAAAVAVTGMHQAMSVGLARAVAKEAAEAKEVQR